MTDENKKPQGGAPAEDDFDALIDILHTHKERLREASAQQQQQAHAPTDQASVGTQKTAPHGQASAAPAHSAQSGAHGEKAQNAAHAGHASAVGSASAGNRPHASAPQATPRSAASTPHTASSSPASSVPPAYSYSSIPQPHQAANSRRDESDVRAFAPHTKTVSRSKVVDFDEVDPANARLRRAKQLKKGAETGKSAAIGLFKTLVYLVCVIGISIFLAVNIIHIGNDVFAFVKDDIRTTVTVPKGASLDEVAQLLKENGIIRYPWVFKLYARGKIDDSAYYTGEFNSGDIRFLFENEKNTESNVDESDSAYSDYVADSAGEDKSRLPMSYDRILSLVAQTDYKTRDTVRVTIPEGYTVDEILDLLIANGVGERDKYIDAIQNYEYNYRFVTELDKNTATDGRKYRLEGYLFPDTYDFFTDENEISVINKLLSNFDAKMENVYYERADELGMSVDEVIILASIIEKEALHAADLSIISSVFHNRMKQGMRLDSDATVVYALPEHKSSLTKQDLAIDSPYNTHIHTGLTPGAISNPGIEAINAAFYPDSTNYYYFFSRKNGDMVYSTTYEQHSSRVNTAIAEGTIAS